MINLLLLDELYLNSSQLKVLLFLPHTNIERVYAYLERYYEDVCMRYILLYLLYILQLTKEINLEKKKLTINIKVRVHCPFRGDYGRAALSICNLRHAITREAPLIMHSGTNYDFHAVIKNLVKYFETLSS